jgi:hypothetical protein
MRKFLLVLLAVLATAAPASAATPPPDRYAPPPDPILTFVGRTPVVQLNDGAGGLPYLGSTHAYNAGDWQPVLRSFHESGAYDREINQIVNIAERYVLRVARRTGEARGHRAHHRRKARTAHRGHGKRLRLPVRPAIVLDIDETSLSNYSAIEADDFTFGQHSQAEAVDQVGTAIAPTLKLFKDARAAGVAVFFITGRGEAVRAPTEANLRREGYDGWKGLYLKPADSTATTVEYKTAARRDIESKGYRIIANLGDQFSDLAGGHAKRAFKLPNPFYFLP